jgi:hypothetical protein
MFVLKALAEKGKNITDKVKKNITQLSSKLYDYAANTSLARTVNKYYNKIKNVPYASTKFVTNLADKLLFRSRAQTAEEKRLAIDQIKTEIPKDLSQDKEKPLKVKEDKDLFFVKVEDKLLMVNIKIPVVKYIDRDIDGIEDELVDDIYSIIRKKLVDGKLSLGFRMLIESEGLYYKSKDDTYETKKAVSGSLKQDIAYVGSISDLKRTISICVTELVTAIGQIENSSTGFKFENFVNLAVRLFYFKNPSDIVKISEEAVQKGFKYHIWRPGPKWHSSHTLRGLSCNLITLSMFPLNNLHIALHPRYI